MAHLPYQITHFYLDEQHRLPELNSDQQGNYLVFWWKEIALGHIFLEPGKKILENEYYSKLIAAINPAIEFYGKNQGLLQEQWQQLLINKNFEGWANWMQTVFSTWLPVDIPKSVPVSVIICTHKRTPYLQLCLQLLQKQRCLPEEIIVVDNAPSDDSTQTLVKQFNNVIYVKEPRAGLDIARNTGVRNASQPVVAFVDDDVTVHPFWVYRVWETFREPVTTAMTGLVIAAELETEAQYIFEKHWSFNRGYTDVLYGSSFFSSTLLKGPPVWKIGAGANMAFRKAIFEEVGYFDELLDAGAAGCNGDSEMWYRILAAGHNIHYNPRAIVYHEHRRKMKDLKKQIFYYMRGFITAMLFQQRQYPEAGYKRHIFQVLPVSYMRLLGEGFPRYGYRYRTMWEEVKGIISGLAFYYKNRNRPSGRM